MKKFFARLFERFGAVVMYELKPAVFIRTILSALVLTVLFMVLPIFAGGVDEPGVFLKGFFYSLFGYYLMKIVGYNIKSYLMNREEIGGEQMN